MTSPYAIALSHFAPFGSRTYVKLFTRFQSFADIWQASESDLISLDLKPELVNKFIAWRQKINVDELVEKIRALDLLAIDCLQPEFPEALRTIYDPPALLYAQGELPLGTQYVGLVGSRQATAYGLRLAKQFSGELAQAGLTIVSGLARGIDTEAHLGALAAGGKTVAVIAHGHSQLTGEKRELAKRIIDQGGAVISEQPPDMSAQPYHFPIRNRIIAGLSRGVVIVEAELPSGTLHTAQAAINANREVFAVPGPVDSPTSAGPHKLIQDGAHLITGSNDVLSVLNIVSPRAIATPSPLLETVNHPTLPLNPEEQRVFEQLSLIPIHIDELTRAAQLTPGIVLGTLTILEIHGKVRHLGGQYYSL